MKKMSWMAALLVMGLSVAVTAQKPDADAQKIQEDYTAAFDKGDAKAIAALYTADGTRLGPDGSWLVGRAAIEKVYADGFAGPFKGAKLTLTGGHTQVVTPDVKVIEGRFLVAGLAAIKGRYVNTVVRRGKTWMIASVVTITDPPAPK
jgi:uncharacterized protein (TIGR02246 family)